MDRRSFLSAVALAVPAIQELPKKLVRDSLSTTLASEDEDASICRKKFEIAVNMGLQKRPINEVIVEIGKTFIGTEYLAHALELPGEERLVVNLRGLDCVSFYENSLVLARCVKLNKMTFDDYKRQLTFIRYRGGKIDRYTSRLHYTTDYFDDNERKGVLKVITREIGGVPYLKTVNFMSTHIDLYRQLKENPEFVEVIKRQEEEINKREKFYIPKGEIDKHADKIKSGDILGITTSIEGMDIAHTGIALWQDGKLHFMHAPITGAKVQITEKTLAEYLGGIKKDTGIIVARPLEPKG